MDFTFFKAYIYENKTFHQFEESHLWAVVFSLLLIIGIPILSKKYLSEKGQFTVGKIIGVCIFLSYFAMTALKIAGGVFDIKTDLPLQLCQFSNLLIILVLNYRKYLWFEILYCWAFAGMLQATITPDLQYEYPHFLYFRYWIGHPGMLLAIVYASYVYEMRPHPKSILKAMLALNVFFVFVVAVNLLLGSNYFFVCHKPLTPSILDYMGPWPWYLLSCELLALANFSLAYLPFWVKDLLSKKKKEVVN